MVLTPAVARQTAGQNGDAACAVGPGNGVLQGNYTAEASADEMDLVNGQTGQHGINVLQVGIRAGGICRFAKAAQIVRNQLPGRQVWLGEQRVEQAIVSHEIVDEESGVLPLRAILDGDRQARAVGGAHVA